MRRSDRRIALGFYRTSPSRELLEHALNLGVTDIDTAFNYQAFEGHRELAVAAGDLIHEFAISTKVGYFQVGTGNYHSLRRGMLREAIEKTVHNLGVPPTAVFLHNPEQSLKALHPAQAYEYFADACQELERAVDAGLCGSWGVASWQPAPLAKVLRAGSDCPKPQALMVRAGLSLTDEQLDAGESLGWELNLDADQRWGMSPFNGSTSDPAWSTTDLSSFFEPDQEHTSVQAAFRLAFELPHCTRLAVGTGNHQHLSELAAATRLEVSATAVDNYRELIATPC